MYGDQTENVCKFGYVIRDNSTESPYRETREGAVWMVCQMFLYSIFILGVNFSSLITFYQLHWWYSNFDIIK